MYLRDGTSKSPTEDRHMLRHKLIAVAATLALAVVATAPAGAATHDGSETVEFADHTWQVKHSADQVGPGPNVFSADNVRVDKKGRLHLEIDQRDGVWRSSEVILDDALGYGTYRFTVRSSLHDLDPNVVLGLFTWSDMPEQFNRELDIEFSRWGNADNDTNAAFTVQPYYQPGNQHSWELNRKGTTVHEFTWTADAVAFRSLDRRGRVLAEWTFTDATAIPDPDTAHARMNLWLFRGEAPTDGAPVRVVVSDFEFTPVG